MTVARNVIFIPLHCFLEFANVQVLASVT